MARQKKKLTRKQQKERRRAATARKRQERGWTGPRQSSINSHQRELLDDMLSLFPLIGEQNVSPEASLEPLMMTLLDSNELAEEPEFKDLIIDPLQCMQIFTEVAEELEIEPDQFFELADEEQEDNYFEMLETTIQRLLTDEVRQDIIDRLGELRLRLKKTNQSEKVAKVAALQMFLPDKAGRQIWPMVGLVQAIYHRSLAAGFELAQVSLEAIESDEFETDEISLTLTQRLAQSAIGQKAESLLKKVPGLSKFLEKEVDKIWEEGEEAIFEGELYLELYSVEELEGAAQIFAEILGTNTSEDPSAQETTRSKMTEETGKIAVRRIDDYITQLFTPERLDLLRARLDAVAKDSSYPKKWLAFRMMLTEYMADENAAEVEKGFLIRALIGELRFAQQSILENTESE